MIYVVNGFPGSGKTTFEDMICEITERGYGYKFSTIDPVKEIASKFGWDGTKDAKNRKFLSDLKDLLTEWNDIPYKEVERKVLLVQSEFEEYGLNFDECAIFIDCREPSEIDKFKERLGAKTMLILRGEDTQKKQSNHADSNVLKYNYDIVFYNNGSLADLGKKALWFAESEGLKISHKQVNLFGEIC